MSTQQYSQIPTSYYGLEHYPYQQYMNGTQGQPLGQPQGQQQQTQTQQQGQTQQSQPQGQPVTQQLLQASQYQQPYGLYYMLNNQQPHPGQTGQYHYQQQQQQQQQPQAQGQQALEYAHYPGYSLSQPYGGQYVYNQPPAQVYAPGQAQAQAQAQGQNAQTAPAQTASAAQPAVPAAAPAAAPPASAKSSVASDTLGPTSSTVGQYQPPGIRPRVTTTMWEDEKTLCYQVDANNVSVVRRADNNMINGTKLLNVAQMTRGRRDGILKLEKMRHVVKIGSMHLKGVWIPFERALAMAQREGIVDLLYPLFVRDIKRVILTGVTPTAQAGLTASTATKSTPLVLNGSYPAALNSMAYYQQHPTQYPPAALAVSTNANGLGISDGAAAATSAAPVAQQQLYGYSQPYYNQSYYAYNQLTGAAATGGSNYSLYGGAQAPVYLSYGYQQPGQASYATAQQLPQQASPQGDKKELKKEGGEKGK